jgi:hypothetical protein
MLDLLVIDKLEIERQQDIDDHSGIVCGDNCHNFEFWGVSDMMYLFRNGIFDACLFPVDLPSSTLTVLHSWKSHAAEWFQ